MTNLILFLNAFLSYFLLFAFVVVLVIIACLLGVKWTKHNDAKKAAEKAAEGEKAPTGISE